VHNFFCCQLLVICLIVGKNFSNVWQFVTSFWWRARKFQIILCIRQHLLMKLLSYYNQEFWFLFLCIGPLCAIHHVVWDMMDVINCAHVTKFFHLMTNEVWHMHGSMYCHLSHFVHNLL
jgi:hypothetical protein